MTVWSTPAYDDHELVVHHRDHSSGLHAIVAIHARHERRGAGGCRMRAYASEEEALADVLRLSRAMSYKAAIAGVAAGGAKSVIVGDPRHDKSEQLLRAMGRLIESLGGAYVSAPDAGIDVDDLRVMCQETRYVLGADRVAGPSAPYTAMGVLAAIRSAVRHRLGADELAGVRVALQGVGSVGRELARLLAEAGASIVVADVDDDRARGAARDYGAEVASTDEILLADVDVVAPNAYGGVLDVDTIPRLRAAIVCGAANNQLAEDGHAVLLHERGILYVPDYVANAGGMIAGLEELGAFDRAVTEQRVRGIGGKVDELLTRAEAEGAPPAAIANRAATATIEAWRSSRARTVSA